MSLLDTFSLLFDTNAREAADDVEHLSDTLDDTGNSGQDAARGITDSSDAAGRGVESFNGLAQSVAGLVAAYVSWQAISASVLDQALATDEIGKFSETLGLSIGSVDAWGEAVVRNGGSADAFRGSVESLNDSLGEVALGGGGEVAEVLGRLGVSAVDATGKIKGVFDILPQLADSFQSLTKQESVAFGRRLGLDQGTILLLQQGRDAVEAMVEQQRQLGGRTKEGYEASAKFNDTMADTQRMFVGVADSANQKILPMLTKFMQGLQVVVAWAQEHENVVTGFFVAVSTIIATMYLPAMASAAAATVAATWPFLAIGAAVVAAGAAFGILYEDVKAYLGGQESFVGSLGEKYEWFGDLLDATINGVKFLFAELSQFAAEMGHNLTNAVDGIGSLFSSVFGEAGDVLGGFGIDAKSVVDVIIAAFELLGKAISNVLGFIASPIETSKGVFRDAQAFFNDFDIFGGVSDAADDLADKVSGIFDFFSDDEEKTVKINGETGEVQELNTPNEKTVTINSKVGDEERIEDSESTVTINGERGKFEPLNLPNEQTVLINTETGEIATPEIPSDKTVRVNMVGGEFSVPQPPIGNMGGQGHVDASGFRYKDTLPLLDRTQRALEISAAANNTAQQYGAAPVSNYNRQIQQQNTYQVSIDARGMTQEEAENAVRRGMDSSLQQSKGFIDDGVDR